VGGRRSHCPTGSAGEDTRRCSGLRVGATGVPSIKNGKRCHGSASPPPLLAPARCLRELLPDGSSEPPMRGGGGDGPNAGPRHAVMASAMGSPLGTRAWVGASVDPGRELLPILLPPPWTAADEVVVVVVRMKDSNSVTVAPPAVMDDGVPESGRPASLSRGDGCTGAAGAAVAWRGKGPRRTRVHARRARVLRYGADATKSGQGSTVDLSTQSKVDSTSSVTTRSSTLDTAPGSDDRTNTNTVSGPLTLRVIGEDGRVEGWGCVTVILRRAGGGGAQEGGYVHDYRPKEGGGGAVLC
jgi:hypothetical protein